MLKEVNIVDPLLRSFLEYIFVWTIKIDHLLVQSIEEMGRGSGITVLLVLYPGMCPAVDKDDNSL